MKDVPVVLLGWLALTVECKVDESFGQIVSEWIEKEPSGKPERLDYICKKLGLKRDEVHNIRYQLLHRTVSALEMGNRLCCKNALMMVNSFDKQKAGFDDYSTFCQLLGCKPEINKIVKTIRPLNMNLFLGWVELDCTCE
jgi:hypothetical protein